MAFFQSKKSQAKTLVTILIVVMGFLLAYSVLEAFKAPAEREQAESICRGSVALREKSYTSIGPEIADVSVATPLLCRTIDQYIPDDKNAKEEQVKAEIAELMVSCWQMFGSGLIEDVFKEGDSFNKNCFVCYNANLRETQDFKEIKSTEMLQYIYTTPYVAAGDDDGCKLTGGYCIDSENRQDCSGKITADSSYLLIDNKNIGCQKQGKKGCCYTEFECLNRGGICKDVNPDESTYSEYSKWKCHSNTKCFIKNENYYSYGDYIQKYSGPGTVAIMDDLKPGDTYAVSFGSPTKECGWCTNTGILGGVLGGGLGAYGGYALAVTSCAALTAGACGIIVFGTTAAIGAASGGIVGFGTAKATAELTVQGYNYLMSERKINTIYLGSLKKMQEEELCSIVDDLRDK